MFFFLKFLGANNDLTSVYRIRAHKVRGTESLVHGHARTPVTRKKRHSLPDPCLNCGIGELMTTPLGCALSYGAAICRHVPVWVIKRVVYIWYAILIPARR